MAFTYPQARRDAQSDDYHGTAVADPYRWLEDPDSEETAAFVAAQNAITAPYLRDLPGRSELQARMTELWDVARTSPPTVRSGVAVWTHNDGLQDQPVYYLKRDDAEPELFLDPNTLADDGAVAVVLSALSPDGRYLAYTVSEAGSDRQRLSIRSTETGEDLGDDLQHLRFTSIAWYGEGFFYTRWPETDPASTEPVRDPSVHYHRVGDPQSADALVFRNAEDPEPGYDPEVTQDDRYLVLTEYVGTSRQTGLLYLDLTDFDPTLDTSSETGSGQPQVQPTGWVRLVDQGQALHSMLLHLDDGFVVHTDRDAANGSVVHMPLGPSTAATTVIAETESAIVGVAAVAGELLVLRLIDASHVIERYSPSGERLGSIEMPGLGSVSALSGTFADAAVYIGYESFVEPPVALKWEADELTVFAGSEPAVDPATMIVERRYAVSSDGAEVGMFVIRRSDAALPGPVELYGYGGFSINMTPVYSPSRLAFMEAGGIVVVANLRGGTELGESWHSQGMLANKQQVFDDFIACGEKLIADGITTAGQLGIRGGSNGGLLTAASMVQRPDLFGAVVSQVPVTDMLRYQHFTAGRFWTVEYGDSADPEAFRYLLEYSPLHNVGDAASYPALLITTAESDDRVVPMHSYKFAAAVQHAADLTSERPLLLRVETRAGHGLGKPMAKVIEEAADIYSFMLHNLAVATDVLSLVERRAGQASGGCWPGRSSAS
ncbi:MAG: prolyl oligopeptidase family serine peptidase [Acidimicrobiales bacterium]